MTSTLTPTIRTATPRPTAVRRVGYTFAVAVNVVMLWAVHQLLRWEWPGFLTDDLEAVLPLVTVSFVASIVVNLLFLVRDRGRFRSLCDLVTAAIGVAVALRTWEVFPFDFTDYAQDWSWLVRAFLAVALVGTSIAVVVNLVKLVRGTDGPRGGTPAQP